MYTYLYIYICVCVCVRACVFKLLINFQLIIKLKT